MSLILIIAVCVILILVGVAIFAGVIYNGFRGKSCDNCKNCSEEFCSQRKEEYKKKRKKDEFFEK